MGSSDESQTKKLIIACVLLAIAAGLVAYFMLGQSGGEIGPNVPAVDVTTEPSKPANRGMAPGAK